MPETRGHEVDGEPSHPTHSAQPLKLRTCHQKTRQQTISGISKNTQLQQSNVRLVTLLKRIQDELNIQHNLMHEGQYESGNDTSIINTAQYASYSTLPSSKLGSKFLPDSTGPHPIESQRFRDTHANFAQNHQTVFNLSERIPNPESLATPDFAVNLTQDNAQTVPAPHLILTSQLDAILGLTYESADDVELSVGNPPSLPGEPDGSVSRSRAATSPILQTIEPDGDTLEHGFEHSRSMIPTTLAPQSSPQRTKTTSSWPAMEEQEEDITALPPMSSAPAVRAKKQGHCLNIKSFFLVKTMFKSKCLGRYWDNRDGVEMA